MGTRRMWFTVAGMSALGGRETNQDAHHAGERLLVVADGVGGAPAGEVASRLAAETVAATGPDVDLTTAVERAHAAVRAHTETVPDTAGMATTLIAAALVADERGWWVRGVHVGDSVTLVQAEAIRSLTTPHTLAAELVAAGHLTEAEGARHPNRGALVRAVGMDRTVRPDTWERPAVPGERYVLCSDGLTDALGMSAVASALADLRGASPRDCAQALVRAACEAGARDNVTVVIGDVTTGDPAWPA